MLADTPVNQASKWAICPELHIDADAVLFDTVDAARAWLQSNGTRGWLEEPLPVISRVACAGSAFSRPRLREWLRAEDIAPLADGGTTTDELVESALLELRGQTAWPTCYLDEDWRFELLEQKAWGLEGHDYTSRRASSVPEVVFRAVSDFDRLVTSAHCAVPTSAVVSFWQSWQMHRHVTRLCNELKTSKISRVLRADFHDWDDAEWTVRRLMNAYARATNRDGETATKAQDAAPDGEQRQKRGEAKPESGSSTPQSAEKRRRGRPRAMATRRKGRGH